MKKKIAAGSVLFIVLLFIILFSIEESRTFIVALILRVVLFVKTNLFALLAAFFLVNGKFILSVFLKKIAMLSATGLGKRYLIEKVINHNLKIHLFDHIKNDIKRLIVYLKNDFKKFPIIKQILAGITFLASLSYIGKFIGGMLAVKVFVAKFWSYILAIFLKTSTTVVYFFTDYLWGLWLAPILEVVIFSWLLEFLEKVPFLKKYIHKIYRFFVTVFKWFENYVENVLHIPVKRFLKYLSVSIKKSIYRLIGYRKVSAWMRLREVRALNPNRHTLLEEKREARREKNQRVRESFYQTFSQKRKKSTRDHYLPLL